MFKNLKIILGNLYKNLNILNLEIEDNKKLIYTRKSQKSALKMKIINLGKTLKDAKRRLTKLKMERKGLKEKKVVEEIICELS